MEHRCGKHVVLANPASPSSIWVECGIHRSDDAQITDRFAAIVGMEFAGEEVLQLSWIVQHGMID